MFLSKTFFEGAIASTLLLKFKMQKHLALKKVFKSIKYEH